MISSKLSFTKLIIIPEGKLIYACRLIIDSFTVLKSCMSMMQEYNTERYTEKREY